MGTGWRWIFGSVLVITLGATGGLVASSVVAGRAYNARFEQERKQEQTLQVTGSARKRIRSDRAVWSVTVHAEGKELSSAYQVLKTGCDRVETFFKDRGFAATEWAAGAIQTNTRYKYETLGSGEHLQRVQTNLVESYALARSYTVTTPRVDEVAKPAAEIKELIQNGVQVVSSAPDYYYTKIGELKIEMIGEASKDARSRADQIVVNAGCEIAEVRHARMGVMQITRPDSTEVSSSGIYDTSTIEKDVMAVVSLTLGLR